MNNKEEPELTALQLAYNQGIEDAKCVIRSEKVNDPYAAPTFINAIARKCSPYWYVAAKFTAPTYDQVVQAITDIQEARESHVQWAAHLRDSSRNDCKGCDDHAAHIGDAAYHDEWIAKYDNAIYVLAHAPFTAAAATPSPETPKSNDAWREWFDRIGDKASAEVVNATADLVTNERLAALVQAGVVPSPETPVGGEHVDFIFDNTPCCKVCGLVRPAEGWTRPCKGPAELSLRAGESQ